MKALFSIIEDFISNDPSLKLETPSLVDTCRNLDETQDDEYLYNQDAEGSKMDNSYEPFDCTSDDESSELPIFFSHFIDGARLSSNKYWIEINNKVGSICLSQISVCCCNRKNGEFSTDSHVSETYLVADNKLPEKLLDILGAKDTKDTKSLKRAIENEKSYKDLGINFRGLIRTDQDDKENKARNNNSDNKASCNDAIQEIMLNTEMLVLVQQAMKPENENDWFIKDGWIERDRITHKLLKEKQMPENEIEEVFEFDYRNVVGISKRVDPRTKGLQNLKKGYAKRVDNTKDDKVRWYLRLREPDMPNDCTHIIQCEFYANGAKDEKVIKSKIKRISRAILAEAFPVPYGQDDRGRWRTHIYPVFVTEQKCKSFLIDKSILNHIVRHERKN